MKYLLFFIALCGVGPASFIAAMNRRLLQAAVFFLPLAALVFERTSINFFSHESYRGTARGMEVSLMYLLALTVLLALLWARGSVRLRPRGGEWFYVLYFFTGVLSLINAPSAILAFCELWKMTMMWLVLLAVANYLAKTGDYDVLWYAAAAVVIGNFPVVVFDKYARGVYQAHGVFPHQNSMAMYMGMIGPLFLSRLFNCRDGLLQTLFWAGVFALTAASAVLTYSRGALVCFPFGCLTAAVFSLAFRISARKICVAAGLVIAGLLALALFLPRVIQRFETAPAASANTRVDFAIAAWNMIREEPLGVGINNWGIMVNPPYTYAAHIHEHPYWRPSHKVGIVETIYLLAAAECGWLGFAALLAWFAYYWIAALRLLWKLRNTPLLFYIPVGIFGGLSAVYAQSALEWVLKQAVNFAQLMTMFAVIGTLRIAAAGKIPSAAGTPLPEKIPDSEAR